jgi:hypothetical protein
VRDRFAVDLAGGLVILPSNDIANALSVGFHLIPQTCSVASCGVECSCDEVEALQRGRVVREMAPWADGASVAGVDRLDRVRAADHAADLDVTVQERDELALRVLPEPADRRALLVPLASNSVKRSLAAAPEGAV